MQRQFCKGSEKIIVQRCQYKDSMRDRERGIYSAGKKKRTAQKGYFGAQKNYLFIIFFFSCLKIVFCELMLLDFSDLLGSFLLRNFFIAARSIFSCKYFSCFIQYIWRFRNQLKICLGGWLGRWHGRIDNKAISAFKQVEVEVRAEFGKIMMILHWFLNLQIY